MIQVTVNPDVFRQIAEGSRQICMLIPDPVVHMGDKVIFIEKDSERASYLKKIEYILQSSHYGIPKGHAIYGIT